MRTHDVDVEKFALDPARPTQGGGPEEVVAYGEGGQVLSDAGAPLCLAKSVKDPFTGASRHFVKHCVEGGLAGRMVDPAQTQDMRRRGDWAARGLFAFRAVNKTAFDLYLRYLRTSNPAHLRQAEREHA